MGVSGQHKLTPGYVEHHPLPNGNFCPLKYIGAVAEVYSIVIDGVTARRLLSRRSNLSVRKLLVRLRRDEINN